MTRGRLGGWVLLLVCGGISLLWGVSMWGAIPGGVVDFQVVYYGTRCLMEHRDPYKLEQLQQTYIEEAAKGHAGAVDTPEAVTWFIYLPTTFLLIIPFALLPWSAAHLAWIALLMGVYGTATVLMWQQGEKHAPVIALLLACLLLANSEVLFGGGNSAGFAVSLCVLAAWCFLEERFALFGVVCLALSLALKPHDGGLVWLYFLLAGGVPRKRALQTLVVAAVLGVAALLWVSQVAPNWMQEWQANVAMLSLPGHTSDAGAVTAKDLRVAGTVIDLQSVVAVFRDDPVMYNAVAFATCGVLLLIWAVATWRRRGSKNDAWMALASVVPLTMLVTYHRPYDAKLLMLAIPACAMLWAQGGKLRWGAMAVTAFAVMLTSDIPIAMLMTLAFRLHVDPGALSGKIAILLLTRAASLSLLAMAVFYLWVYARRVGVAGRDTLVAYDSRRQEPEASL